MRGTQEDLITFEFLDLLEQTMSITDDALFLKTTLNALQKTAQFHPDMQYMIVMSDTFNTVMDRVEKIETQVKTPKPAGFWRTILAYIKNEEP